MNEKAGKLTSLKVTIAQVGARVGDFDYNLEKAKEVVEVAKADGSDLIVFPELFVTGYPIEDLVLKPAFIDRARDYVLKMTELTAPNKGGGPAILVGVPTRVSSNKDSTDYSVHNSVVLIKDGAIEATRHKVRLPNYGVFDEKRYFTSGIVPNVIDLEVSRPGAGGKVIRIGVPICEDIWSCGAENDVVDQLVQQGAEVILVPNASPFTTSKVMDRKWVGEAVVECGAGVPLVYVNQVCGQDELVFDGASFVMNPDKEIAWFSPQFKENVTTIELVRGYGHSTDQWGMPVADDYEPSFMFSNEAKWQACCLGLRDYVVKNGFYDKGVVLGLSGGIDSAVVAAMAVDALGKDKVHCVMLPFKYTSEDSLADAKRCAENLGVRYEVMEIEHAVTGMEMALSKKFAGLERDVTEENIQARIRGTMLMAISNKFGCMVLTTGNKSEVSVGYATLYGDMNGGFNPIKDLYKTEVFELAEWRNEMKPDGLLGPDGECIPPNIISKPPSAELAEGQMDANTLPDYDDLDVMLKYLIDKDKSVDEVVALTGYDRDVVARIENKVYVAEYKREQAAPGVKIGGMQFGSDRRYPVSNSYRSA